jgi:peptidoglycan/LPS O-acetylase OafA/YrhL
MMLARVGALKVPGPHGAPGTALPERREIASLTSLRGIAALLVVLHHFHDSFGPALDPDRFTGFFALGYLWVDFFFILSGFILAEVYWRAFRAAPGPATYRAFLVRRIARIYPLHLLMLLAFLGLETLKLLLGGIVAFGEGRRPASLVTNLLLVQAWGTDGILTWNNPSWSISAEWAAYLLFPLILRLRDCSRLAALLAVPGLFGLWLLHGSGPPIGAVPQCLGLFGLGILTHRLAAALPLPGRSADGLVLAAGAAIMLSLHLAGPALLFVALSCVLILGAYRAEGWAAWLLAARPLHALGAISYSVYMVHWFVFQWWVSFLRWRFPELSAWQGAFAMSLTLGAVLVCAVLSHRHVEIPCRRYLTRFGLRLLVTPRAAPPRGA